MTMTGKIRYKVGPLGLLKAKLRTFAVFLYIIRLYERAMEIPIQTVSAQLCNLCDSWSYTIVKWCNRKKADVLSSKRNKNKRS